MRSRWLGIVGLCAIGIGCDRTSGDLPLDSSTTPAVCPGEPPPLWPGSSGAPALIAWSGWSLTFAVADTIVVLSLEERVDFGWRFSVIEGDTANHTILYDEGLLAKFSVGDRIEIVGHNHCQADSGCKNFSVFRKADTHELITANFDDGPEHLPAFAAALGTNVDLHETCSFARQTRCYVDEVRTLYFLAIGAKTPGTLSRYSSIVNRFSSAPVNILGRGSYTGWLGEAASAIGSGFVTTPTTSCPTDAGSYWASGAVHLTVAANPFAMAAATP